MISVLQDSRDLVFLHVLPTAPADGNTPHLWEIYAERHNTNTSAEIANLFPVHHPHDDLPDTSMTEYLSRAPLEVKRAPISITQKVLAQTFRIRGSNPAPRIVVAHPPEVMLAHLRPYVHPDDLFAFDLYQLDPDAVIANLELDARVGTCFAVVQALIRAYSSQFAAR